MKLTSSFSKFLENTVSLNPTRVDVANSSIQTITDILKADKVFGSHFINVTPQGSVRQRTIIKPPREDMDFDVDLLFELKPFDGWEPTDYLSNLADQFRTMDRYKNKVDTRGKNRCVTIDYERDFHVDVVPTIKVNGGYLIMNKETNQFERTNGDGYASWFEKKGSIVGGDGLASVVQLIKYVRDAQGSFEVKSILLTTLIGHQILDGDTKAVHYADLPTALLTVLGRLDSFLQMNPMMPNINNPVLPEENFNRKWDQSKYEKFRAKIHDYSILAQEAYITKDANQSLGKWRKIFGDKFPQPEELPVLLKESIARDQGEEFLSDFGISEDIQYKLIVDARVEQDKFRPFLLRGSQFPLKKKRKLSFLITGDFPGDCSIKWKVKNYDSEAKDAGDLRGEITEDRGLRNKIENTKYAGSHYVEAYAIRNRVCIAKDRLIVPIASFA